MKEGITIENTEMLNYAIEHGMIDLSHIEDIIEMNKRKELLSKHTSPITQGRDGYWRTYLPDKEKGRRQIKKRTKTDVEDAVISYWKSETENPTVQEVFKEYNDRRLSLNQISLSTHLRNTQIFNRHYKILGSERIKSLEPNDIEEFLEEQIAEHELTAKAFSNLKCITRGLLKRAKKRKLITFNVEEVFQDLDISDKSLKKVIKEDYQEVFNDDELPSMIHYLSDNIDLRNLGILLMFVTGIRVGELVTLKHSDFVGNTFNIRRTETRYKDAKGQYIYDVKDYPKTGAGVRTVIIPNDYSWIADKMKLQNAFGEYIFVENGERLSTASIRRRMYKICNKLDIYRKSPHKARKTYGTILLDSSVDKNLITSVMGHTDILCTENHYHRNRKKIEKKSEILSAIPEFMAR